MCLIAIFMFVVSPNLSLSHNQLLKLKWSWEYNVPFQSPYIIELEGEKVTKHCNFVSSIKCHFTNAFRAIWHHISIIQPNVAKLKECANIEEGEYDQTKTDIFVVDQIIPFYLEKDIFVEVRRYHSQGSDENGTNKIKVESIVILLISYKKTTAELRNYVVDLENNYLKDMEKERNRKIYQYRLHKKDDEIQWHENEFRSNKRFHNLFFEGKDRVLKQIDFFLKNEAWYEKEGVPYTLGICLHGGPGTGKTSFIKALTNYLGDRHLVNIALNKIPDEDMLFNVYFEEKYNRKNRQNLSFQKKIIVMEDIDCMGDVVKKRDESPPIVWENAWETPIVPPKPAFTLSCLLNLIDGLEENHGRILIMTTNCYSTLDPALIRPGRVDLDIEMKNAKFTTIREIFEHFYAVPFPVEYIPRLKNAEMMPSQLIKIRKESHSPNDFLDNILRESLT